MQRLRRKVVLDLEAGKIDHAAAAERLSQTGEEALACQIRGGDLRDAGDLDGAERWFWKGLDLQPSQFGFYLSLADLRAVRNLNDPLAPRLLELALWKLGDLEGIEQSVAQHFRKSTGSNELDFDDPETYRMLATVREVQRTREEKGRREDEGSPSEAHERLLPYILLGDLQRQAPEVVDGEVLHGILRNAARCGPLFWAALRDWASEADALHPKAVALFTAVLGEIGGVELLPDLLELAFSQDTEIFMHAHWAICRLGRRFPEPVLEAFRQQAADAPLGLRCAIAEHLAMLPKELDVGPVARVLTDGFRGLAKAPDAAYLLMTVGFALEMRKDGGGANLINRYGDMLSRKARAWFRQEMEGEDSFLPRLVGLGIDELDIEDVCLNRTLMDEEDEEDEEDEDEDFDGEEDEDEDGLDDDEEEEEEDDEEDEDYDDWEAPSEPVRAPPKPGRNDPCWCGSGKKYKKCHLEADEADGRSGRPAPAPIEATPETGSQAHKRLGNLVLDALQDWYGKSEMKRAFGQYFGPTPPAEASDAEQGDLFLQWYLHDYRSKSTGRTAFAEYLRREGGQLNRHDRAMLESMRGARYGLYQVERVEEGHGVEIRNVYQGDRFFVHDVSASKEVVKWDCLLTRVEHFEGRYTFTGNGQVVPRLDLERLKSFIEAESRKAGQEPAGFVEANCLLIYRQLLEVSNRYRAEMSLTNAMGEPIEFSSATYRIVGSLQAVLGGLHRIEGFEETTPEDHLTGHFHFTWAETGVQSPRAYGDLEIAVDRLRLSCTSRRRLEIGRQMLEKALRRLLRHEEDRFETVEEAASRMERDGPPKTPKAPPVDPEIERALILKYKTEHYAKWVDEALEALDGQTPREAVRTAEGRRKVLDLIHGIENIEERLRKSGRPAFDVTDLRRTLGLTGD